MSSIFSSANVQKLRIKSDNSDNTPCDELSIFELIVSLFKLGC